MPEFKPCPFCGSSEIVTSIETTRIGSGKARVCRSMECLNCGAKGPVDLVGSSNEDAEVGWDRRVPDATLQAGLRAVETLINESYGVEGFHLNGDIAQWDEIRTGGFSEGCLLDFDAALAELDKGE